MNTVYAWGYGDVLTNILQGVASLFSTSGGLMVMLGKITILIAFMIVLLSYFSSAGMRDPLRVVRFYIVLLGVWTLFMQVKTTVQVHDLQANQTTVVDNVPWAIAKPLAFFSQVQKSLAETVDMAFGLPDKCQYSKTGMFTCVGVLNSALSFRITDPYLYTSLNYFIQNCVYTNILDGTYDLQQLLTSDNIINMFGQNLHPSRYTKVYGPSDCPIDQPCSGGCKQGCSLDCPTAWGIIQGQLNSYAAQAPSVIGGVNMTTAGAVNDILGTAPAYLLNASQTGSSFLLQTIGINHFQDAYLRWAEANLAPGLGYGVGAAQRQVEQTGITSSFMAGKYLPVIKGIVMILLAGLTPALFILLLTPMAMRALYGYAILFLWVLVWTLGDAIINAIIQVKLHSANFASLSGTSSITSLTLPLVSQTMMDYVAMAGQFYWLVPTLSLMASTGFAIYAMNSVVSSVANAPASSSSQVGSQTATGSVQAGVMHYGEVGANNIRMGNTHWGNASIATTSFLNATALQQQLGNVSIQGGKRSVSNEVLGQVLRDGQILYGLNPMSGSLLRTARELVGDNAVVETMNVAPNGQITALSIRGQHGERIDYDGTKLGYTDKGGAHVSFGVDKDGKLTLAKEGKELGEAQFQQVLKIADIIQAEKSWAKALETAKQARSVEEAQKTLSKWVEDARQKGWVDQTVLNNLLDMIQYVSSGYTQNTKGVGKGTTVSKTSGQQVQEQNFSEESVGWSFGLPDLKNAGRIDTSGGVLRTIVSAGRFGAGLLYSAFNPSRSYRAGESTTSSSYQDQSISQTTSKNETKGEGGGFSVVYKPPDLPYYTKTAVNTQFTSGTTSSGTRNQQNLVSSFVKDVGEKASAVFNSAYKEALQKSQDYLKSLGIKADADLLAAISAMQRVGAKDGTITLNDLSNFFKNFSENAQDFRRMVYQSIDTRPQQLGGVVNNVNENLSKQISDSTKQDVEQFQKQVQEKVQEKQVSPKRPKKP